MDIGKELERITAEPLNDPIPHDTPETPVETNEPIPELEPLVPA